jgi:thiosulfate reductase cytochrome b subunit
MTHTVVSYLLALFLLVHLYIITTGETVFANLLAMITGRHHEDDGPSTPRENP